MARQPKLGTGKRAAKIKSSVAAQYRKKGYSAKRAAKIGGAVVGMTGRKKYGTKRMAAWSAKGRKRAK
jgi:hypothetical protein